MREGRDAPTGESGSVNKGGGKGEGQGGELGLGTFFHSKH